MTESLKAQRRQLEQDPRRADILRTSSRILSQTGYGGAQAAGYLRGLERETFALMLIGSVTTTAALTVERTPEQPLTDAAPAVRAICKRVLRGEEH